jgi:transcriptional regulator with XRE-family HTH domain
MQEKSAASKGLKRMLEWDRGTRWEPMDEALGIFGRNVRDLAEFRKLSIKQLADRTGISERTMWAIVASKTRPQFSTIVFLSQVLKVPPSDLLLPNRKLRAKLRRSATKRRKSTATTKRNDSK